jgi:hypothetical protein
MKSIVPIVVALVVLCTQISRAQISPGELSKPHEGLEGVTNCTQCHESGREISGAKCLTCHTEIQDQISSKRGFHFSSSTSNCVSCHKEHLGRDAHITKFDETRFDHTKTGFLLAGKHGTVKCEQCHAEKNITKSEVKKNLAAHPHKTFLGLDQRCVSCHVDRHRGTVSQDCQSCHSVNGWSPAATFDHGKAKFALVGKHKTTECTKCHTDAVKKGSSSPILFSAKEFKDCKPCHTSPHGSKFADKTCQSCHTPEGWKIVASFNHAQTKFPLTGKHSNVLCAKCHTEMAAKEKGTLAFKTKEFTDCKPCHTSSHNPKFASLECKSCHVTTSWATRSSQPFDHSLTKYKLEGKHAAVACEKCHKDNGNSTFAAKFLIRHDKCADCHTDYHKGQFTKKFGDDCAQCHTERSFVPSTFTFARHAESRLPLKGAHTAVPCNDCHKRTGQKEPIFRLENTRCDGCHADKHNGQFAKEMAQLSCGRCHSTKEWKMSSFDHSNTRFRLVGRHLFVSCAGCHKETVVNGVKSVQYLGLPVDCQSCHRDIHANQFAKGGITDCTPCHTPNGWHSLLFNHESQSAFQLTGAHKNVPCRSCHKEERIGDQTIVRFKPISSKCESCHQGGK